MRGDFDSIYEKYRDNVFAIGFNFFKNQVDADDVVQEVFCKYYKSEKDFESEEHIRNWLIRVAINECKRVTLSSWFKTREPLDDYAERLAFETPEQSQLFFQVMKLQKKYRQVVHLYYYEDYSIKEIAEILQISPTAVTTRLGRARKQLKEKLTEVWENE